MRRRAFTLVELLIVVGIIAVLISMLLPAVNRARETSKRTVCLSNLRSLGAAFQSYVADNSFALPGPARYLSLQSDDWIYWESGIKSRDLNKSPVVKYLGPDVQASSLRCPSDDIEFRPAPSAYGGYHFSYSMNANLINQKTFHGIQFERIKNPSSKILVYEEDSNTIDDGYGTLDPANGFNMLAIRHDGEMLTPDTKARGLTVNGSRQGNVAFCDGHADYIRRLDAHSPAFYDPAF